MRPHINRRSTRALAAHAAAALVCAACWLALPAAVCAQETHDAGTITGRVTLAGHELAGARLALVPGERLDPRAVRPVARATTDEQGRYRMRDVPPGRYQLLALAPGFVVADAEPEAWQTGRVVNVLPGDQLDGVDFALTRGGVITGRVTDADERPIAEVPVRVLRAPQPGPERPQLAPVTTTFTTDDRGVYRIYGLAAGRYLVHVGDPPEWITRPDSGPSYPRTFYGDTTVQAQARVVEVAAGAEVTGVDITVGRPARTFEATGRVVDERGRPVAGVTCRYGLLLAGGGVGPISGLGGPTNERGEFRLPNLSPGRYVAYADSAAPAASLPGGTYSAGTPFQIVDQDVTALVIKLVPGVTISGTAGFEDTSNPALLARLGELTLRAFTAPVPGAPELGLSLAAQGRVNADGSFLVTGVPPGRVRLSLGYPWPKGFTLARVERDGAEQPAGLEVAAGEQVKGVRVVLAYHASVIRGLVQFPGGARPEGRFVVTPNRVGAQATGARPVVVDAAGRFIIEELGAGEHELLLYAAPPGGRGLRLVGRKLVTVPEAGTVDVTLTFEPEARP
ncbi:MAG TPA: carboxypeptidase-like regulatory domain-containing protein [Pyrinomonadaceae bacterium]|jgi:hypothetical protein